MADYESFGEHKIVKVTDAAVAIDTGELDGKGRPEWQWIPRSVIEDGDLLDEGEEYELEVEMWFLEKEGLV